MCTFNFLTASSNLHREDMLCHYDNDSSSDEGSEFSTDQISLHEKSLTSRLNANYLSTLREVSRYRVVLLAEDDRPIGTTFILHMSVWWESHVYTIKHLQVICVPRTNLKIRFGRVIVWHLELWHVVWVNNFGIWAMSWKFLDHFLSDLAQSIL